MTRRWIHASRPLIVPTLLIAALGLMVELLNSLSFIDRFGVRVVAMIPSTVGGWLEAITNFGSVPALLAVATIGAGVEYSRKHWTRGTIVLASMSSLLAFRAVKELVRRARPVTEFVASRGLHDYSFPSGHTTGSTAIYGILAYIIWNNAKHWSMRLVAILLVALIILIGISRVYVGAHFLTDVIGGWILGYVLISLLRSASLAWAKHSQRTTTEVTQDTTENL